MINDPMRRSLKKNKKPEALSIAKQAKQSKVVQKQVKAEASIPIKYNMK